MHTVYSEVITVTARVVICNLWRRKTRAKKLLLPYVDAVSLETKITARRKECLDECNFQSSISSSSGRVLPACHVISDAIGCFSRL